jgi:hypothetical protein
VAPVIEDLKEVVRRGPVPGARTGFLAPDLPINPTEDKPARVPQLLDGAVQSQVVQPLRPFGAGRSPRALASASPAPDRQFDTLGFTNFFPPDSALAAGPAHLMSVVNGGVQVRRLDGAVLSTVTLAGFFPNEPTRFLFDPRLSYDEQTGRFIMAAVGRKDANPTRSTCVVAVSATSDPTGAWAKYWFDVGLGSPASAWADYPSLGYDGEGIYVSFNLFSFTTGSFVANRVLMLDKAAAMGAQPLTPVLMDNLLLPSPPYSPNQLASTIRPVEAVSPVSPTLFLARAGDIGLVLYKLTDPLGKAGGPTMTSHFIDTSDTAEQGEAPQPKAAAELNTGDARLQKTVYRNGVIWTSHSLSVTGTPDGRSAVIFYRIDPSGSGSLLDADVISDPNRHYFFPALMPDAAGNGVAVFHGSSPTEFAGTYHARYDGATGTFEPPVQTAVSTRTYESRDKQQRNRWGDYSDAAVDVLTGNRIWIQGQLAATGTTWKMFAARVVSTMNNVPDPPSALQVTAVSATRVSLRWKDESPNETGFLIERRAGSGLFAPVGGVGTNLIDFTDETAAENTPYTYRVRATGPEGDSNPSNEVSATTALLAPVDLKGSAGSPIRINLSWTDASSAETGYRIERRKVDTVFSVAGTVGPGVSAFADTPVTPNTTWIYRVITLGSGGAGSSASSEVSVTTPRAGKLTVKPVPLKMNKVPVGKPRVKTLTLKNKGAGTLTGTVGAMKGPFAVTAGGGAFTLAPKASRLVTVRFTPSKAGPFRASLPITSDDPARRSISVSVNGRGR